MKKKWSDCFPSGESIKKTCRIMRLTLFLLLGMVCSAAANSYSQTARFSVNLKNSTVLDVIKYVEENSNFVFLYRNEDLNLKRTFTVNFQDASIQSILDEALKGNNVVYNVYDRQIVIRKQANTPSVQPETKKRLTGVVKGSDGTSVPGVSVFVKGTSLGTITDIDGRFSIEVPPGTKSLGFSFVGMKTIEVPVGSQTDFQVKMQEEAVGLDEVVAVGYGVAKKRDLTGAVSRVDSRELENRPVLRVDQMLQGQAPGVDVKSISGEPGGGTTIRIRGARSINATNEPLYVIDGLIGAGDLNSINPDDVLSIDILKDASSTAIYGSRGANGVIIVTTKRGSAGRDNISVNVSRGVEHLPENRKPELMNAAEFIQFIKDARENIKTPAQLVNDQQYKYANNFDLSKVGEGTDWVDAVTRVSSFTNVNIGASGGNEKLQYYLSGNYADQEGIVIGSGFTRYQFRLNLDKQYGKILKIGTSINFSNTFKNITNVDLGKSTSWTRSALSLSPTFPLYNEDGSLYSVNNFAYSGGGNFDSPLAYNMRKTQEKGRNILANFYLDLKLMKGLNFRSNLGMQYNIRRWDYYNPTNMPTKIATNTQIATAETRFYTDDYLLSENTLTYDFAIDRHKVNMVVGTSWQNNIDQYLMGSATGFTNDIFMWNNLGAVDQVGQKVDSNYGENTMISFLGRANYNFADKYYLTVTGRYDGASNFALDNKWGFFPSAAVKWRLTEENFIKDLNAFENLSMKISYGKSGNQGISNYASLGTLSNSTTGYIFGNNPALAYYSGRLPSNDLTWETSTQIDLGIEASILKGRLSAEANYYNTKTKDLLLNVQIPSQTGYSSRLMNLGETFSRGFELMINSRNVEKGKFAWRTQLTLTTNKQEIVDLGPLVKVSVDNNSYGGTTTYYEVGVPLGALYGAYYEGTWKSQAEIDQELALPEGQRQFVSPKNMYKPGRMKYRDINQDGLLDQKDMPYQGSPNPKVFGRIENNFKYGNWDLDIAFNASFGAKMYNDVMFFMGTGGGDAVYTNQYRFFKDYWHPTRNPESNIPAPNSRDNVPSTYLLQDASFVRFSTLKLGYTINTKKLGMDYIKGAYVYFSGNNLWLFSDYNNFDPEVNRSGTSSTVRGKDDGAYPNSRAFTFGVKVDF